MATRKFISRKTKKNIRTQKGGSDKAPNLLGRLLGSVGYKSRKSSALEAAPNSRENLLKKKSIFSRKSQPTNERQNTNQNPQTHLDKTVGFGNMVKIRIFSNKHNRTPIELNESTKRLARLGSEFSKGIVKKTLTTNYFNNNRNNSKLLKLIRNEENKYVKKFRPSLYKLYNKYSTDEKDIIRGQVMDWISRKRL
jgi:hypothetical protein